MVALPQLLLSDVAAKECEGVRVGSKSKVLAGHADAVGFPALQVTLVDVAPLLRSRLSLIQAYEARLEPGARGKRPDCSCRLGDKSVTLATCDRCDLQKRSRAGVGWADGRCGKIPFCC